MTLRNCSTDFTPWRTVSITLERSTRFWK